MTENEGRVRYEVLIGASFLPGKIIGWFSNYGYHDSAMSLARVNNAIMGAVSPGSTLTIVNYPLPYSIENLVSLLSSAGSVTSAYMTLLYHQLEPTTPLWAPSHLVSFLL